MTYVIRRPHNEFVAKFGAARSHTKNLKEAEKFTSREYAERNLCEGESVVPLEHVLNEYRP